MPGGMGGMGHMPQMGLLGGQPKRFIFQSRTGRLNWRLLHSLDIDRIMREGDVESIQSHMDNVTFSKFSKEDLEMANDDLIIKLVQIEQLCIEYLHSMCASAQQILQALVDKVRVQAAALQATQAGNGNGHGRRGRHASARPVRQNSREMDSVRVVHPYTPQKCPFCTKRFQSERYLHEHMHRRHQGEMHGGAPQPHPIQPQPIQVQQVPVPVPMPVPAPQPPLQPAPLVSESVHQPFQAQVAADIAALRAAEEQAAKVATEEVRVQVEDMRRLKEDMRRQLADNTSRATEAASSAAAAAVEEQVRKQMERQLDESRRLHDDLRRHMQESTAGLARSATQAATADVQETVKKQMEVLNSMQEEMRRQMAENVRQLEASAADGARKAVGQAMASLPQDGGSAAAAALASSAQAVALEENLEKQIEKWRSMQEGRMMQIETVVDTMGQRLTEATQAAKDAAAAATEVRAAVRQRSASPMMANPQEQNRPRPLEIQRDAVRPAVPVATDPVEPIQPEVVVTQPARPTLPPTQTVTTFEPPATIKPALRPRHSEQFGPPELIENMAGGGRYERGFKEVWEEGLKRMQTQAELDLYMLSMFQERTRPRMPRPDSQRLAEGDVHLAEEFRQHWSRNFGSEDQPHFVDVPQPPAPEELDPEAEALRKQKAVTEKAFLNGLGIFLQRCRASTAPAGEAGERHVEAASRGGPPLPPRGDSRGAGLSWRGTASDLASGPSGPGSWQEGQGRDPQQSPGFPPEHPKREGVMGGRPGPHLGRSEQVVEQGRSFGGEHSTTSRQDLPFGHEASFGAPQSAYSAERWQSQAAPARDAMLEPESSWASGTHLMGEHPPQHLMGLDRSGQDTPKNMRMNEEVPIDGSLHQSVFSRVQEPRPAKEVMASQDRQPHTSFVEGRSSFVEASRASGGFPRDAVVTFTGNMVEENLDSVEDLSADFMHHSQMGTQRPAVGISGASSPPVSSVSYAVHQESPAHPSLGGWAGSRAGGGVPSGGGPMMVERVDTIPLQSDQVATFSPSADDSNSPTNFMRPQKQTVIAQDAPAFMDLDELREESF